ncbi:MAG: hypothetical protein LWW93_16970 [Hyphomicrobiales bacterium]|nr:hypothetical protein [Hyphomicrobiales bacterium]
MSTIATSSELMERLERVAVAQGLETTRRTAGELAAKREAIRAKWLLGARKLVYTMSLRLDDGVRLVRFREATKETSWGLPPPTLSFQTETISGKTRSGARHDVAPGGGGEIDYAAVRTAMEQATRDAGWGFEVELRLPG